MKTATFVTIIFVLIMLVNVAFDGSETGQAERQRYCEMVAMWEADASRGLDEWSRDGHPNYNRVECER